MGPDGSSSASPIPTVQLPTYYVCNLTARQPLRFPIVFSRVFHPGPRGQRPSQGALGCLHKVAAPVFRQMLALILPPDPKRQGGGRATRLVQGLKGQSPRKPKANQGHIRLPGALSAASAVSWKTWPGAWRLCPNAPAFAHGAYGAHWTEYYTVSLLVSNHPPTRVSACWQAQTPAPSSQYYYMYEVRIETQARAHGAARQPLPPSPTLYLVSSTVGRGSQPQAPAGDKDHDDDEVEHSQPFGAFLLACVYVLLGTYAEADDALRTCALTQALSAEQSR